MFQHIEPYAGDPILTLNENFQKDPRPDKINLSIGIYFDDDGQIPVMAAVREAEARIAAHPGPKPYLPMEGLPAFRSAVQALLFGLGHPVLTEHRVATIQAVGSSGGLKVGADFIHRWFPQSELWVSDPTWDNHKAVFDGAGVKVHTYPYYNAETGGLRFDEMLHTLRQLPAHSVVLLHACCHNPSGFDLAYNDWQKVLEVVRRRELLPLIDFAYQGFGDGLEEDARAVRLFAESLPELLVTSSCSKNFGLYRDRVGALLVCAANAEQLGNVRSQLASLARNLWSTPPAHGAEVVATILGDPELKQVWLEEVTAMRTRIAALRLGLVEALQPHGLAERFAHIAIQRGMFSYTGLSPEQVRRLREEHSVYLVGSSRANVAGLDANRLDDLARAIAAVCA